MEGEPLSRSSSCSQLNQPSLYWFLNSFTPECQLSYYDALPLYHLPSLPSVPLFLIPILPPVCFLYFIFLEAAVIIQLLW